MNKLKPINHDLPGILWCGPAALSAVTGRPTSEIHAAIKAVRHSERAVRGVSKNTLEKAAVLLGVCLVKIFDAYDPANYYGHHYGRPYVHPKGPTLAKFLRRNQGVVRNEAVIIVVTGHYVVVSGNTFVDNQVDAPTTLKNAPGRRRRVKYAWKVVNLATV